MNKIVRLSLLFIFTALPLWADEAADHYQAGLSHYGAQPREAEAAASEFSRAAELGHASARTYLGLMYLSGQGLPQNYVVAVKLLRQAAKDGEPQAQLVLGQLYRSGQAVKMSKSQALIWFRRAAQRGNPVAQAALAEMYAAGQEVALDYVSAHMWWNILAGAGNKDAAAKRAWVEVYLTPAQLARAQRLAADFRPITGP